MGIMNGLMEIVWTRFDLVAMIWKQQLLKFASAKTVPVYDIDTLYISKGMNSDARRSSPVIF